jgi:hypothetical protein
MDFPVLRISSSFPFDFAIAYKKLRAQPQRLMTDQEHKKSVKMRKKTEIEEKRMSKRSNDGVI